MTQEEMITESRLEVMRLKQEVAYLSRERSEHLEQINNLGRFIGYPGCTVSFIVSEAVSRIEQLQNSIKRQNA